MTKSNTVKVAALQLTSFADVEDNLAIIESGLSQSPAIQSVDLLVLPENFACMANEQSDYIEIAEEFCGVGSSVRVGDNNRIQQWLSEQAKKYQLWLVAGSIPLKSEKHPNKVYSSCLVYNPEGECVLRYDKIHLFDVIVGKNDNTDCEVDSESQTAYQESKTFIKGKADQKNTFTTPWGDVAVSICYDLRFPELHRRQSETVVMHCIPAAFTKPTGKAHWEILLRARAIENQTIIIASGQVGTHANQRETWGHSMIVDAWGSIEAQIETQQGLVCADISFDELHDIRQKFPCLSHRQTYH